MNAMQSDSVAIQTKGLTRRFGAQVAVSHLDLTVRRGEVFGFLGPNGAGKTTTVRLLNGILAASEGSASVLDLDVRQHGDEIRRHTGVLTETPSLYEALTARENLFVFGDLYGIAEDRLAQRVSDILDEFGLSERANDRVGSYSKGMKQRLAIARALLHQPALIFLDEPTASLDPAAARQVTATIQQLSRREGRTIFLCTHNLAEAQRLCDRVGVIDHGILRAVGTPHELANQLWQGVWIEVDLRGDPSPAVLAGLDRLKQVGRRRTEEGKLLLEGDSEESIPDIVQAITAAGGRIYSIFPREHTLEEIYFRIAEQGAAQEGGVQ